MGITFSSIDTIKIEICKIAAEKAKTSNDLKLLIWFLAFFSDETCLKEIKEIINEVKEYKNNLLIYKITENKYQASFAFLLKRKSDSLYYTAIKEKFMLQISDIWGEKRRFKTNKEDTLFIEIYKDTIISVFSDDTLFTFFIDSIAQTLKSGNSPSQTYKFLYERYSNDGDEISLQRFWEYYPYMPGYHNHDDPIEHEKLAKKAGLFGRGIQEKNATNNGDNKIYRRLKKNKAQIEGDIRISLIWNNYNDIDIHCYAPGGEHIYYKKPLSSSGGKLDIDMNVYYEDAKRPVENIIWDYTTAPNGTYKASIVYFKNHDKYNDTLFLKGCKDPTDCKIEIAINNSVILDSTISAIWDSELDISGDRESFSYTFEHKCDSNRVNVTFLNDYISKAHDKELAFVAVQRIVEDDIDNRNFKNAADTLRKYVNPKNDFFKNADPGYKKTEELIKILSVRNSCKGLQSIDTNSVVNTTAEEMMPVFSTDSKELYFCREVDNLENILFAKLENGVWSNPEIIEELQVDSANTSPLALSVDGSKMLLFRDGDIYLSKRSNMKWGEMEKLPPPINTEYGEFEASFVNENDAILFTSNRPGGYNLHVNQNIYHGNATIASDIYIALKDSSDYYSEVINLGPRINTLFSERSPYLHPNNKTLYFSSDGHAGLGRLDVFKSERLSDTCWNCWSEPANMGTNINTSSDNWGFNPETEGVNVYYSMDRDTSQDIFRIEMEMDFRAEDFQIQTFEFSDQDGKPLDSIKIDEFTTSKDGNGQTEKKKKNNYTSYGNTSMHTVISNEEHTLLDVTANEHDTLFFEFNQDSTAKTYVHDSLRFKLIHIDSLHIIHETLDSIVIYFPQGKFEWDSTEQHKFNEFLEVIKDYPGLRLEFAGYANSVPFTSDTVTMNNDTLSFLRAKQVFDYLFDSCSSLIKDTLNMGSRNFLYQGYGTQKPVLDKQNKENKEKSKRVEILLQIERPRRTEKSSVSQTEVISPTN